MSAGSSVRLLSPEELSDDSESGEEAEAKPCIVLSKPCLDTTSSSASDRSLRASEREQFLCDFCARNMVSRRLVALHIRLRHNARKPSPSSPDWSCKVCRQTFKTRKTLTRHCQRMHRPKPGLPTLERPEEEIQSANMTKRTETRPSSSTQKSQPFSFRAATRTRETDPFFTQMPSLEDLDSAKNSLPSSSMARPRNNKDASSTGQVPVQIAEHDYATLDDSPKPFECKECGSSWATRDELQAHLTHRHSPLEVKYLDGTARETRAAGEDRSLVNKVTVLRISADRRKCTPIGSVLTKRLM